MSESIGIRQSISRQELYNNVWESPVIKVCQTVGLSDRGLGKLCKRYDIPSPPRGYWARLAAGEKIQKPALELSKFRPDYIIRLQPQKKRIEGLENPPEVKVSKDIKTIHPIVKALKESIGQCKNSDWVSWWEIIVTSGKHVNRALLIFDSLLREMEKNGHRMSLGSDGAQCLIDDVKVQLRIIERSKKILTPQKMGNYSYNSVEYEPRGVLSLELRSCYGVHRTWTDGKKRNLEEVLGHITVAILAYAKHEKERKIERERERRRWERQEQIKAEKERRVERLKKEISETEVMLKLRRHLEELKKNSQVDPGWINWVEKHLIEQEAIFHNSITLPLKDTPNANKWLSYNAFNSNC